MNAPPPIPANSTALQVRVPHPIGRVRIGNVVKLAEVPVGSSSVATAQPARATSAPAEDPALLRALQSLTAQLQAQSKQTQATRGEITQTAVDLATTLVEHLFAGSLSADNVEMTPLLEKLVAAAGKARPLEVRMHPADLALLESHWQTAAPAWADAQIRWLADTSLARGNCLCESDSGGWMFDWRHQLKEIRRSLAQEQR